jgi:4'-phosphopantetheinyl transferase
MPPAIGPRAASLASGEVHVWVAELDATDDLGGLLSPAERERARRFARRRDGRRWGSSRALLRLLLGEYLHADPRMLRLEVGEHGKPRLAGEHAWLRFNMSHSGPVALYAVAREAEVGVDVERLRRRLDRLAVAERAFGRTAAMRLGRLDEPEREREFLQMWVRHEVRLKCLGVGLGRADAGAHHEDCWTMDVDVSELAVGALAALHPPVNVECWRWEPAPVP